MLTANYDTDEAISFDEFRAAVRAKVSISDPKTMLDVGRELVQLANNRDLLAAVFAEDLKEWRLRDKFAMYSTQSTIIGAFDEFVVRANFWPRLPSDPRRRNILASVLSYFDYHDHDFSFLTTNFYGPGYATDLYRYDYENTDGILGEPVEMQYTGRKKLGRGDVFLFEQGLDIHSQLEPEMPSASLNLMFPNRELSGTTEQYYFSVEDKAIKSYLANITYKNCSMLGFTDTFADERTAEILGRLATGHKSKLMRATAVTALSIVSRKAPVSRDLFESLLDDPAELVRQAAARGLEHACG